MKLFVAHPGRVRLPARQSQGMTLVEVLIATFLMTTCIIGGLIAANMMGLRYESLLESKAGASDSARKNITQLKNDIYGAKGWQIGSWSNNTFTAIAAGNYQQGPALIIYPLIVNSNQIVDLSQYTLYYFDSSDIANNDGRLWYLNTVSGANQIMVSNLIAPLLLHRRELRWQHAIGPPVQRCHSCHLPVQPVPISPDPGQLEYHFQQLPHGRPGNPTST